MFVIELLIFVDFSIPGFVDFFFLLSVQVLAVAKVMARCGSKDLHSYSCSFRALLQALLSQPSTAAATGFVKDPAALL